MRGHCVVRDSQVRLESGGGGGFEEEECLIWMVSVI